MSILNLIFFSFFSIAGSNVELNEAQLVWQKYNKCGEKIVSETTLIECANPLLAENLVRPSKMKLIAPLDMGILFSSLSECHSENLIIPNKIKASESYFCMSLEKIKRGSIGYVVFTKENSKAKIVEIKYKY